MPVKATSETNRPETRLSSGTGVSLNLRSIVSPSPAAVIAKKKKRSKPMSFGRYLLKTLKELHPDIGLSYKTVKVMDNYLMDMMNRIATEAGNLAKTRHSVTLTHRDVESACKLILPGELAKLAMSAGNKAMMKYDGAMPETAF